MKKRGGKKKKKKKDIRAERKTTGLKMCDGNGGQSGGSPVSGTSRGGLKPEKITRKPGKNETKSIHSVSKYGVPKKRGMEKRVSEKN